MPKGILFVETQPSSPEQAAAYHKWYNETHLQEIVSVDGFVSARRLEPVGHDGPFIAIYEIDADDFDAVAARLKESRSSAGASSPVGVSFDPPPTMRYFREIANYSADGR